MTIKQIHPAAPQALKPKRTAAYARVSSGKEAMLHSLAAQVDYYAGYIGGNPRWEYAGVFADEAMTGTKDSRPEFQRLLGECRAGNIDLVITKSISRMARDTLTVLESVRELKSLGVDIFFEEQNIHSMSGDGELMLSILSSFAQEESRSASENCKWRIRNDFKEGKISGMCMLGYRLEDGKLVIVPEEAGLVRAIFADYLSGMGCTAIAKKYYAQGIHFCPSGISQMLRNEKYQGEMLLQKRFTSDHLAKRRVKNTGQLPQYLVEVSHEAIISKEQFAAVQAEIARRALAFGHGTKPQERYPYAGLIKCGKCGAAYRRRHAAAGSKYEKITWICRGADTLGKDYCDAQQIPEDILDAKVAEVGGTEQIAEIRVPGKNTLIFIMKNGRVIEAGWQHASRSHSWTPEMKEAARQRQLELARERRERHG